MIMTIIRRARQLSSGATELALRPAKMLPQWSLRFISRFQMNGRFTIYSRRKGDNSIDRVSVLVTEGSLPLFLRSIACFAAVVIATHAAQAESSVKGSLGRADLKLIDRATWGVNGTSATEFASLGRDRWLDAQIRPSPKDRLPAAVQAVLDSMPISSTPAAELAMSLAAQARAANQLQDIEQKKAAQQVYQQALNDLAKQAATRSLLRDLYSPDQLREKMTWFWFNHFNIFQNKSDIRAFIGDYEEHAIRPYALSRFRDLLVATLQHPAMLRYLPAGAIDCSGSCRGRYGPLRKADGAIAIGTARTIVCRREPPRRWCQYWHRSGGACCSRWLYIASSSLSKCLGRRTLR
jgi:hypothetical protein